MVNLEWVQFDHPFKHVIVPRVFPVDVANKIDRDVKALVRSPGKLRHFGWYDAYSIGFSVNMPVSLRIFISQVWHDIIAEIMQVPASGHVNGGIHHHQRGSRNGFVHNDFNTAYFDGDTAGIVKLPRTDRVSYTQGTLLAPDAYARKVVRCTTLIYYTSNFPWRTGDGGETGLYRSPSDDLRNTSRRIPPLNNSMLIFNCTPDSYHSFLANPRYDRNCIVMWLHSLPEDTAKRFTGIEPMHFAFET